MRARNAGATLIAICQHRERYLSLGSLFTNDADREHDRQGTNMEPASQTTKMIEQHLRHQALKFSVDQSGRFRIAFERVGFVVVVESGKLLVVRAVFDTTDRIGGSDLVPFANHWNTTRRWPRLFVNDGELHGDVHQVMTGEVTQADVDQIISVAFGASFLAERELEAATAIAETDLDHLVDQLLTDDRV